MDEQQEEREFWQQLENDMKRETPNTAVNLVTSVAFAVTDPSLLTVDLTEIQQRNNKYRAEQDAKNPPKTDTQRELDGLLQKHFDLKQQVRACENWVNEASGRVHIIEERITAKIKERDANESPLGKRNAERAIEALEFERDEAMGKRKSYVKENSFWVAQLRTFETEQLPRIEELRKLVKK